MNLVLTDVTDSGAHKVYRLKRFPALVGSGRDAEVPIDRDGVSRRHAGIVRRDSRYYVVDLGSRNGTRLHRVQGGDLVTQPAPVAESAERVDEGVLGAGNELRDGLYLAVGAGILRCVMEPDASLEKMDMNEPAVEPEPSSFRLAGLIVACVLLVGLTLLLGFRAA